jgi:hypothetical protein
LLVETLYTFGSLRVSHPDPIPGAANVLALETAALRSVAPGNILSAVPLGDDWLERSGKDANRESQQIPVG